MMMLISDLPLNEAFAELFGDTARWRREKAEEYPDDKRNLEAADLLDKLAEDAASLPHDHPVLKKYEKFLEDVPENFWCDIVDEDVEGRATRDVGFYWHPETAVEFITPLLDQLERLAGHP